MKNSTVLITESPLCRSASSLGDILRQNGYVVLKPVDASRIQEVLLRHIVDLIIVSADPGSAADALAAGQAVRRRDKTIPLIMITQSSNEDLAIAALKTGINDYFRAPFFVEDVMASIRRLLEERPAGQSSVPSLHDDSEMIGNSRWMQELKLYIRRVADTESNVLITGETGTGKELVAAMIHRNGRRRRQPFICLNCAAIPDSLLESELFGYERGAFTGAFLSRTGHFERANGGSLFLDEIGDMSPYAQAKILRAIESKEIQRVGGKDSISLDVRIIAATNLFLDGLLTGEKFRKDLFFRLNVARIHLRPLRERREDIPALLDYHIAKLNCRFGRQIEGFTSEMLSALVSYDWAGNVRELKTLLEAIFINSPSQWISFKDLPEHCRDLFKKSTTSAERDHMLSILSAMNWNKTQAAKKLQWSRMTLYRKIARYHLTRPATEPVLSSQHS
ncbi:MAG TPA: sigma-54 dependent transcriptional regulator [Nitrospirales bacterium]|jgi:DNA-binding NtrC family response regulator